MFLDYAHGFGGKFGVETDRQDKSAAGWNEKADLAKHESQKGPLLQVTPWSFPVFYVLKILKFFEWK